MTGKERSCILNRLQQAGFAVDEAVLYLDTHPCDHRALAFYQKARDEQRRAACEYTAKIGRTIKCGIMKNDCNSQ